MTKIVESIYKPSKRIMILNLIMVLTFCFILSMAARSFQLKSGMIFIMVLIIIFLIKFVFERRVYKLIINQTNIQVFFIKNLHKYKEDYNISLLEVSFKKEVGPRGSRSKVFRINSAGKTIVKIIPQVYGWSSDSLKEIYILIKREI